MYIDGGKSANKSGNNLADRRYSHVKIPDNMLDSTQKKKTVGQSRLAPSDRESGSPEKSMPSAISNLLHPDRERQANQSAYMSFHGSNNSYDIYEQTYYQNLIRYSPTFALLFSELVSLEPE